MKEPDGKRVAVIFNPYVSGDRVAEIEGLLFARDIMFEMIVCNENLDPYRKVLELEIDNYSALVSVGGDGTLN